MSHQVTLVWFRQDLRLSDHPALAAAIENGKVLPVFIWDEKNSLGAASQWWLHHSLTALNQALLGKLNCYKGNPFDVLKDIIQKQPIDAIYWNRCYDPLRIEQDSEIKAFFKEEKKIDCQSFNGSLLWEPWSVLKADKTPYKVFTPFYRKGCQAAQSPRGVLPDASSTMNCIKDSNSLGVNQLDLLKHLQWSNKFEKYWSPGEQGAQIAFDRFLNEGLKGYKELRNYPSKTNVSRLSPHLHFGEISPHQIKEKVEFALSQGAPFDDVDHFLSELGWREFSHYLLYHFKDLPSKNFQSKFDNFPWEQNLDLLKAWQKGKTGYPIIDAGMRELWETGYMHNRVRMIVGSFLVKNLLLDWRLGEKWFRDCLIDADIANNSASWQWVAGSGADAAPYFRIFNPILQGEKFDEQGDYTRKFVPELALLPDKYLFQPWEAPSAVLKTAKVILGVTYPHPVVSLTASRDKALAAYRTLGLHEE